MTLIVVATKQTTNSQKQHLSLLGFQSSYDETRASLFIGSPGIRIQASLNQHRARHAAALGNILTETVRRTLMCYWGEPAEHHANCFAHRSLHLTGDVTLTSTLVK